VRGKLRGARQGEGWEGKEWQGGKKARQNTEDEGKDIQGRGRQGR
jgi:hypothetical protein